MARHFNANQYAFRSAAKPFDGNSNDSAKLD